MSGVFPFFFNESPDPDTIDLLPWQAFAQETRILILILTVLLTAALVGLYAWRTRKLMIQQPRDPFLLLNVPFWLRWACLTLLPGLVVGAIYWFSFRGEFPSTPISPWAGAFGAFLLGWLGSLALGQVAIWVPGVTPPKFLYHPRWPWRFLARRRALAGPQPS